jgi:hypothetical protein
VLEWLAARLPAPVMPDHMTALGVLAALGIGAAYWLSHRDPAWLGALAVRAARNLRVLAAREPAGRVRPA